MTTDTAATAPTRLLHTMLRVFDLERSLDFYVGALGMRLLRRSEHEGGRFTLAFVGYGDEASGAVLELTHNWDQSEPYALGSAYGHIALAVRDARATCDALVARGVRVPRPAGPMQHGSTVIAFLEDPDGYRVELIERP